MEAHPVPQNVTAFEFHLVGNMTMRQFGYLAIGCVAAYLFWAIFAGGLPLFAYPMAFLSASIGAAYAFLPILERPLDYWTKAFIKAIQKPTQRKYHVNGVFQDDSQFSNRLALYMQTFAASKPDIVTPPKQVSTLPLPISATVADSSTSQMPSAPQPTPDPQIPDQTPQAQAPIPRPSLTPTISLSPVPPTAPEPELQPQSPTPSQEDSTEPKNSPNATPEPPASPAQTTSLPSHTDPLQDFGPYTTEAPTQPAQNTTTHDQNPQIATQTTPTSNPVEDFLRTLNSLATEITHTDTVNKERKTISLESSDEEKKIPSSSDLEQTVELAEELQIVQHKIAQTEKQVEEIKWQASQDEQHKDAYTQQFQNTLVTLQQLNQRAHDLSKQIAELAKSPVSEQIENKPAVKPNIIPSLTLTSTPNIVNGIVVDTQGNYVEGAIVVAHDKQNMPVRALKTNKLGQFIAATPLAEGLYNLSVEKENLDFDVVQVELNGSVINPIVISAKREGG